MILEDIESSSERTKVQQLKITVDQLNDFEISEESFDSVVYQK